MSLIESVGSRHTPGRGLRGAAALFALGLVGVFAAGAFAVTSGGLPPEIVALGPVVAVLLLSVQSAVLLAVAVLVGAYAAPRVGFRSRTYDRANGDPDAFDGLGRDLRPAAALGGLAGVALLAAGALFGPSGAVSGEGATVGTVLASVPLRFLYGGLTEEILLRWGLMSVVAAALWRLRGGDRGSVSDGTAWAAILVAAVLFGVGHLPAAAALYGGLTPDVVAFVVLGNALGGIAYGWLFWRRGLEAAMAGHAATHVVFVGVSLAVVST